MNVPPPASLPASASTPPDPPEPPAPPAPLPPSVPPVPLAPPAPLWPTAPLLPVAPPVPPAPLLPPPPMPTAPAAPLDPPVDGPPAVSPVWSPLLLQDPVMIINPKAPSRRYEPWVHSTRHCRRAALTHNASGETIDDYTTFEWHALCAAVVCVDFTFAGKVFRARGITRAPSFSRDQTARFSRTGSSTPALLDASTSRPSYPEALERMTGR